MTTNLRHILERHVSHGNVPGAVALVGHGDRVEVQAVGSIDVDGTAPMARDSIFRIASITKPVTATAVMLLIDDGLIALDDEVREWLPELASPTVVRTPASPVGDVVPLARPITVRDLLTSTAGYGFLSDFSLPAVALLYDEVQEHNVIRNLARSPDEWLAALSRIPLLHQPGEAWLSNTCSDIQGVLVARASGRPFSEFLSERLFEPLGMSATGFAVPAPKLDRLTSFYRADPAGGLELVDGPDGPWSSWPAFASGAFGLVSTVDDWHSFARMLLSEGTAGGRRLLSPASVRQMTTNHLTRSQREAARSFLEGQGWGLGGSVDVAAVDPLERAGALRLGRRHRNGRAHHPLHRRGHDPAQPGRDGRRRPDTPDARRLALRGRRLR